jgi:two-component system C4-dicarboxylate transport sensor histidine kinase DctB
VDDFRRLAELAEVGVATVGLLHELRQPLMAAKGLLELAHSEARPPSAEELALAADQLAHLQEVVEHHVGLGRREEPPRDILLLDGARWVQASIAQRARRLGASVAVDGEDAAVRLRPMALRQILLNLVGNALDAVSGQPVRQVSVRAARRGDRATVAVTDTGPGVPEGVAATLFDPFVTTKPAGRGTGLGLWIARALAEEAGGAVVLADTGPRGTRIEVRLPVSAGGGTGGSASS